jgi:Icc-related predicted phosphoesterase
VTTIFFATDVHGSDICWKKFISAGKFYKAEVLILGGDMTGKAIVPIIHQGGETWKAVLLQQDFMLHGQAEVDDMAQKITSRGYYPYRTTPDEIAELGAHPDRFDKFFHYEVLKRAGQWLAYADEKLAGTGIRCYVSPGNDDMFELDDLVRASKLVQLVEGMVVQLDANHEMISSGWSNITPWHTYREESEEQLQARLDAMLAKLKNPRQSVFNIHVPPYGSCLDEAPELTADMKPKDAGRSLIPVGSHAVRKIVDQHQPLLGLFGHVHEGKGAVRLGKTLCINPGSMYEQGRLLGTLINLDRDKIKNYILTTG